MITAAHVLLLCLGSFADALVVLNGTGDSLPTEISSAFVDPGPATKGCLVEVPVIHVYTWQPRYELAAATTADVATDSAGTQITSIPITTGAYRENGVWTALTSLSTITFPTGYTDIGNDWRIYPTSGTSTAFGTWLKLSTATPYNPSPIPTQPIPIDDPGGLQWIFYPIYRAANQQEIAWIQSAYSEVPWIRKCEPTAVYDPLGKPPIAAQITGMVKPSPSSGEVERTQASAVKTLAPEATIETASKHKASNEDARKKSSGLATADGGYSISITITSEHAHKSTQSSTSAGGLSEPASSVRQMSTNAARTTQQPWYTHEHSGLAHPSSPSLDTNSIYVTNGNVIYQGHTIRPSSTATMGSGSVRTLLALTTNKHSETVVVEGVVTQRSTVEIHVSSFSRSYNLTNLQTLSHAAMESSSWMTQKAGTSPTMSATLSGNAVGVCREVEWWIYVAVALVQISSGLL